MRWCWAAILVGACGDPGARPDAGPGPDADRGYRAGPAENLSLADGDDEDPAVLAAADGSIHVAWTSEDAGGVVIARTTDGRTWSAPVEVTAAAAPSLAQAGDGTLHLVAERAGAIVHTRSIDGGTWTAPVEVAADGAAPALAFEGALVVAFVRAGSIHAARSTDGGDTWTAPAAAVTAGGGVEHHLPALARDADDLVLAWTPYAAAEDAPWDSVFTQAHVAVIRSPDGESWSGATDVTAVDTDTISVFPALYADHDGALHAAWMVADLEAQRVVELPLASPTATPRALPHDGHAPVLVATPEDGLYLGAWVAGPPGERDVHVRVFGH